VESNAERIERLEREIADLAPTLRERLESLEKRPAPKPLNNRLWGLAEKAIVPVVLLVLGFVLKDSVELALKRQQLELAAASQIQELVQKLGSDDRAVSQSAAVTLATFGDFATIALARELQEEGTVGAVAAEEGLRSLALSGSPAACEVLLRILSNRTQLYDWRTHRRVARLLGELECHAAHGELERLNDLMSGNDVAAISAYGKLVNTKMDKDDLRQMREAVNTALTNLGRSR